MLGTPLMPWQQHVADVSREIDNETGKFAYHTVILMVPRQSGKSTLILAAAVHRAFATKFFVGRQNMVYSAQNRNKSREKFETGYVAALESSPLKNMARWKARNGSEHIAFSGGSRWSIDAAKDTSGHGATLDEAFIDEAFAQKDGRLEQAFRPTMITRENTQFWLVSTAGWLGESVYFEGKVTDGRARCLAGERKGVAYFEWSAPENADPGDPAVWRACMPALGHTISEDGIRAEFEAATDKNQFRRAWLNQFVPKLVEDSAPVSLEIWNELHDPESSPGGKISIGVSASADQSYAAISIVSVRDDGMFHVELVDMREGDGWVIPRLVELADKWNFDRVALNPESAAASQTSRLAEAGMEVEFVGGRKYSAACAGFFSAILDGNVRHRGQQGFETAFLSVRKKTGTQGWQWTAPRGANITPLVAATLAYHTVFSETNEVKKNNLWVDFSE